MPELQVHNAAERDDLLDELRARADELEDGAA